MIARLICKNSKSYLTGRRLGCIIVSLLSCILPLACSLIESILCIFIKTNGNPIFCRIAVFVFTLSLSFLFSAAISLGKKKMYYLIASTNQFDIYSAFYFLSSVKLFFRAAVLSLNLLIRKMFFAVVIFTPYLTFIKYSTVIVRNTSVYLSAFLVPIWIIMIIVCLLSHNIITRKYLLAEYIIACNDDIPIKRALRLSSICMRSHCSEATVLELRLFPLSSISSIIIPKFFIMPRIEISRAIYALYISEKSKSVKKNIACNSTASVIL